MKFGFNVLSGVVCGLMLAACHQEAPSTELPLPQLTQQEDATTPVVANKAGGYEPSAEERVPGITMSQQELDKIYNEARRNMPMPVIPDASHE